MLFSSILEVYSVDDDEPIHSVTFDTNQTSFTYVNESQLVISDDKGRLSVFYGIDSKDNVEMRLVRTPFTRLKSLQASPDGSFFTAVTNESIAIWGTDDVKEAFDERPDDLMCRIEPTNDIPQS